MFPVQTLLVAAVVCCQLDPVQAAPGSKARFDAVLAKFGFTGLETSSQRLGRMVVAGEAGEAREGGNEILQPRTVKLNNGLFVIAVKRSPRLARKLKRGPGVSDPGRNVIIPQPQLLNERIKNPIFKSKYPGRQKRLL